MRHKNLARRDAGPANPMSFTGQSRRAGEKARGSPARGLLLGLLIGAGLSMPAAARPLQDTSTIPAPSTLPDRAHADFGGEVASPGSQEIANWVVASRDNRGLPFIVVDKIGAKVFVFDAKGEILGAAAALLGMARGDDSVPGIGQRKLATIRPAERTTPAGRFEAALGNDLDQDILWVDYDAALSLHRVIVGNPKDRRHARLASPTPSDNRISYGCINVPAHFYDAIVAPAFRGTVGIVYILPETRPLEAVFAIRGTGPAAADSATRAMATPVR